jgi:hypothetical protein
MRAWPQLLCLLLAFPTLAGCGKAPAESAAPRAAKARQGPPQTLPAAKAIYTAGGKVGAGWFGAVAVQPGAGQRYLVLVEWIASRQDPSLGRYRLLRLDLSSREVQQLAELGEGELDSRDVACARSGRIAIQEERPQEDDYEHRIRVREPDGQWRPVTDWTLGMTQTPVAWSADSSALLYHRFSYERSLFSYDVAASSSATAAFAHTAVTGARLLNGTWSKDGRRLYGNGWLSTRSREAPGLIAVDWPSQTARAIPPTSTETAVTEVLVAADSGDVVMLRASADWTMTVWRMPSGSSRMESAGITLPARGVGTAISPDSKLLAVVLGRETKDSVLWEGGLIVYRLDDGRECRVPDTVGKNITAVHWVLGGRALVFTIAPKGIADYEAKGAGQQVWMVEVEPVPRPALEQGPRP